MRVVVLILLFISFAFAKDTFFFSVKPTMLFRINEKEKDYRPGLGVTSTFMAKPDEKFGFGVSPEYIVWSLKFEDESVTYNIHSLGIVLFSRKIFPINNELNIYIQIGGGSNFLITSYGKQGFSHVNNSYIDVTLKSSIGINVGNFDFALKSGFFNESDLNETFVWLGFSIGAAW